MHDDVLSAVREEWLRRVEAEYRAAARTQAFTLWLTQLGAPHELLRLGLRIASDELAHAELSAEVHRAAGGTQTPCIDRKTLDLVRTKGGTLEHDVLRVAMEQYCLGKAAAVRIFGQMQKHGTEPVVRRAFRRILRDEVAHRDFGWELLAWLLQTPAAPAYRSLLESELPSMLERQRTSPGAPLLDDVDPVARTWGLLATQEYLAAIDETTTRDCAPHLSELGL